MESPECHCHWFQPYLSDRMHSVMVDSLVFIKDRSSDLCYSPLTHNPYIISYHIISYHSCDYHKYTDDTEISDSAPPGDFTSAQPNIQSCISDTLSWMQSNKLKLNTEKTEMFVGSSVCISSVGCESADIGGSCIPFQTTMTLERILTKHCQ